jgi:AcrR family transcriptional regulator
MVKSPWAGRDRAAEREEKREAVLHAAAQAFAEKGYHGTSLDDIAALLGVTKPTLYYYARNKDDLIIGASLKAMDLILGATETDPNAPALVQLQDMLRRYAEVMMIDYGRCITVMRDARIGGEAGGKLRDNLLIVDRTIRRLLELGMTDGSIAPCDPKLTTFVIAGAINSITRWYNQDGELSAAAIAERVVNQLAVGLAPR